MIFEKASIGRTVNPETGECWNKVRFQVSLEAGESPEDVAKAVIAKINETMALFPVERPVLPIKGPASDLYFNVSKGVEERI